MQVMRSNWGEWSEESNTHFGRHNEERLDLVLGEVGVPLDAVALLDLVAVVEEVDGDLGDVHAARHAARLHVVGERDVVRPDVVLPLAEADDAAQHVAAMHADSHVDVDDRRLPDLSAMQNKKLKQLSKKQLPALI